MPMEERRGPEYIPARLLLEKRTRSKKRVRWLIPPLLGVGLAFAAYGYWSPRQSLQGKIEKLMANLRTHQDYHAVEYRGQSRDREYALREDFVKGARRKYVLFNGEVTMYIPISGTTTVFEKGPFSVRHHSGSLVSAAAPQRLLADLIDQNSQIDAGQDGGLSLTLRNRRTEIKLSPSGLPTAWTIYHRTEKGEEILSRFAVEWDNIQDSQLEPDLTIESAEEIKLTPDGAMYREEAPAVAKAGPIEFVVLAPTSQGDLIAIHRSASQSLFLEVQDEHGGTYEPAAFFGPSRNSDRSKFMGESLCIRSSSAKPSWPLNLTIKVWNFDPKMKIEGVDAKLLATYPATFSKPVYSYAPSYWFAAHASDRPYFDFLRNRHYRRALATLTRVRAEKRSGKRDLAALEKAQSDALFASAIGDLREVVRLRAEFEGGGTLPMARLYASLAELQSAAGLTGEAAKAIDYAQELARTGRSDANLVAEIEQVAKDLGL